MKKILMFSFLLALFSCSIVKAQTEKQLKKVLELKVEREGGANGGSVAWHPKLKKYYAAMAGNSSFFLGVFDTKGTLLSSKDQEVLFDMRGLWYNDNTKTLQMNGFAENGWGEYTLDKEGIPTDVTVLHEGENQPYEQSAGTFNSKEKLVYFFNEDGNIEAYDFEAGVYLENIKLSLGGKSDNYSLIEDYNSSTAIYTGNTGAEIGLLNHTLKEIELYNIKTGELARILLLPSDAPANNFLNFAYCNGIYWLFDKTTRTWKGYK